MVILCCIYFREEDAENIYRDAIRLNLTEAGYAWFVTEQALRPANTPNGKSSFHSMPCISRLK